MGLVSWTPLGFFIFLLSLIKGFFGMHSEDVEVHLFEGLVSISTLGAIIPLSPLPHMRLQKFLQLLLLGSRHPLETHTIASWTIFGWRRLNNLRLVCIVDLLDVVVHVRPRLGGLPALGAVQDSPFPPLHTRLEEDLDPLGRPRWPS